MTDHDLIYLLRQSAPKLAALYRRMDAKTEYAEQTEVLGLHNEIMRTIAEFEADLPKQKHCKTCQFEHLQVYDNPCQKCSVNYSEWQPKQ